MHLLEKLAIGIRHNSLLQNSDRIWNHLRPYYNRFVCLLGRGGLERRINESDRILVNSEFRGISEVYEPDVWRSLMGEVQPGDVIGDVGAFIGLYTIALAKRVGSSGQVVAFEPDAINFNVLKEHIRLNEVANRVKLIHAAVGSNNGYVPFQMAGSSESHIVAQATDDAPKVPSISLDHFFANSRVDILKLDVEGYEEEVLKGATNLLKDHLRGPRVIYIEVHPYAWQSLGTSSRSLLDLLANHGYQALTLDGKSLDRIERWGEIIARRISSH